MKSETIWVVAADGAMARFLYRARRGFPLEELTDLSITAAAARKLHGYGSAVRDGVNHGHHGQSERHDGHDADEHSFLAHIAGRINLAAFDNAFGRLVLCAPPRALGVLRSHLTADARGRVVVEIAKDIVRENLHAIDERLKDQRV